MTTLGCMGFPLNPAIMPDRLALPGLMPPSMSVTRQMASLFQDLEIQGIQVGFLGPGYPTRDYHQFVSTASDYLAKSPNPADTAAAVLGYSGSEGMIGPRKAFANIYGNDIGVKINPDTDLVPAIGTTGAMDTVLRVLGRSQQNGDPVAVFCPRPTYTGWVIRALQERNVRLFSVNMDGDGLDSNHFEHQIEKAKKLGCAPTAIYTIPTGDNPTGTTYTQQRRNDLVEVLARNNMLALEDSAYHYMTFSPPEERPATLMSMAPSHMLQMFSFSKLGAPGLRVAYIVTQGAFMNFEGKTGTLRDQFGASFFMRLPQ